MDFFDYAMSENPSRQFRHTYNLSLTGWDGRSVVSSWPLNLAVGSAQRSSAHSARGVRTGPRRDAGPWAGGGGAAEGGPELDDDSGAGGGD